MRTRTGLDGEQTSFLQLGYENVGLDDGWQQCGAGLGGSFHDAFGRPLVNLKRFPSLSDMTSYGHQRGLRMGFYGNNCICGEVGDSGLNSDEDIMAHYVEDVKALVAWGFDGVKLDACGQYLDVELWGKLLNESGRQVLLENCHWGMCAGVNEDGISGDGVDMHNWNEGNSGCPTRLPDGNVHCPFHFFRTSGDIDASETSWLRNLASTVRFLDPKQPLAGRGCWAYGDMLEVGNMEDWISFEWQQAHFGAWVIMSSPLILGFDLRDDDLVAEFWPFLANKEALAVSQTWAGHPGWRVRTWTPEEKRPIWYNWRPLDSDNVFTDKDPIDLMQIWTKPMPGGSRAVLVINADAAPENSEHPYSLKLGELGMPDDATVLVRDIWNRADRAVAEPSPLGTTLVEGRVKGFASDFLLLTPYHQPLPPSPLAPPKSPPPFHAPVRPPPPSPMPPVMNTLKAMHMELQPAPPQQLPPPSPPAAEMSVPEGWTTNQLITVAVLTAGFAVTLMLCIGKTKFARDGDSPRPRWPRHPGTGLGGSKKPKARPGAKQDSRAKYQRASCLDEDENEEDEDEDELDLEDGEGDPEEDDFEMIDRERRSRYKLKGAAKGSGSKPSSSRGSKGTGGGKGYSKGSRHQHNSKPLGRPCV